MCDKTYSMKAAATATAIIWPVTDLTKAEAPLVEVEVEVDTDVAVVAVVVAVVAVVPVVVVAPVPVVVDVTKIVGVTVVVTVVTGMVVLTTLVSVDVIAVVGATMTLVATCDAVSVCMTVLGAIAVAFTVTVVYNVEVSRVCVVETMGVGVETSNWGDAVASAFTVVLENVVVGLLSIVVVPWLTATLCAHAPAKTARTVEASDSFISVYECSKIKNFFTVRKKVAP